MFEPSEPATREKSGPRREKVFHERLLEHRNTNDMMLADWLAVWWSEIVVLGKFKSKLEFNSYL